MAISKAKKAEILEKLKEVFRKSKSLVFVNFRGLSVVNATLLRRTLNDKGVSYRVSKKTLTRRVLEGEKFKGAIPPLEGELALAWGEDLVAPAREIYVFQKKFPEHLRMMGGIFEGRFMTAMEMEEIALIPTLEVLRGKFVNIINSSLQRWVIALGQIAEKKLKIN